MASDIYTIGRTLMVLAMEFRGYQSTYVASLPPVSETPLFQQHDSLYRLLVKACAPDPADRFASADELRVQLLGVLREVVAAGDGQTGAPSTRRPRCCSTSPRSPTSRSTGATCPRCGSTTSDPQSGWLRTVSVDDPVARLAAARGGTRRPPRRCCWPPARAALEAGRTDIVASVVRDMLAADPWEWRAVWLSGLAALSTDDAAGAQAAFNAVYGQVPGELAPKLALALACETSGELDVAESLYATCARTDANYIAPAAFGLARIRGRRGDLDGVLAALDLVPPTSRAFTSARRQRAGLLAELGRRPARARRGDGQHRLPRPSTRCDRATLTRDVLQAALGQVLAERPRDRASRSPGGRRSSRPCATGSRPPTASWPRTPPPGGTRASGRPGQRRTRWTLR